MSTSLWHSNILQTNNTDVELKDELYRGGKGTLNSFVIIIAQLIRWAARRCEIVLIKLIIPVVIELAGDMVAATFLLLYWEGKQEPFRVHSGVYLRQTIAI